MKVEKIQSNSHGNAVVYGGRFLVDCGVNYKQIKEYREYNHINDVLITHVHSDHYNLETLKKMKRNKPNLNIYMYKKTFLDAIELINDIDDYDFKWLQNNITRDWEGFKFETKYKDYFEIILHPVEHDVSNVALSITQNTHAGGNTYYHQRAFHATDCGSLDGIQVVGEYDVFAIEMNYQEKDVFEILSAKESFDEELYNRFIDNHLSLEQAMAFIKKTTKDYQGFKKKYEVIPLHMNGDLLKSNVS